MVNTLPNIFRLCEAAGMKTTWVLTDEERKQKFEGRGKRKSCSGDSQPEENKEEASTAGKKVFFSFFNNFLVQN